MNILKRLQTDDKSRWILTGMVFFLFVIVAGYQLTNASLWFDETIEFYYSKYLFAGKSGGMTYPNMYQRIISTYQPPLYNIFLFYWLFWAEGEWWFRFSGVVLGFVGAAGICSTLTKITNYKIGLAGVVLYTFIFRQMYYVQECAEYVLMLAMLYWAIYFFISVLEEISLKKILLFVLFCILAVYSQYGAVFPVVVLLTAFLIRLICQKDWAYLKKTLLVYTGAFLTAALPLYYFFVRIQIKNQGGKIAEKLVWDQNNIFLDFKNAFTSVFQWNLIATIDESGKYGMWILLILFFIVCGFMLIQSKSAVVRYLISVNAAVWLVYYAAVKSGIYAYGKFGNRYNLFFIPLWVITIILVIVEFTQWFSERKNAISKLYYIYQGMLFLLFFCYCLNGWNQIKNNWEKEDIRGVTEIWYEKEGYLKPTFVYYGAKSGFSYYLEQHEDYKLQYLEQIIFQDWMRDKSREEYKDYIMQSYQGQLPKELYVSASHYRKDFDTLIGAFTDYGYEAEKIFDHLGAKLYLLRMH